MARLILIDTNKKVTLSPRHHYLNHWFFVPEGVSRVGVILTYYRKPRVQIFVSLFDPIKYRGTRMNISQFGELVTELWVGINKSSLGGLSGYLPSGNWRTQIDLQFLDEACEYHLEVFVNKNDIIEEIYENSLSCPIINHSEGWYKGELHCHTNESDGICSVNEVVDAALSLELDFLALSDHFTNSQWAKLAPLVNKPIALLPSVEITSHHGHANLHGLKKWVDVFVDRSNWAMNQAADDVHKQGGLFCVNHPFSGELSWKDYQFDWGKADLIEIYHNLEGANNNFHLPFWDYLLNNNYRIIGVGGTDSHDPYSGNHRLSQLLTWVYAPNLSVNGILNGLRSGNVYVSLGPKIYFSIINEEGHSASMGETLNSSNGVVKIRIQSMFDKPLRLFIIKGGLIFKNLELPYKCNKWCEITLNDQLTASSFYRLEFHLIIDDINYPSIEKRDYTTTAALSNPIWVNIANNQN